MSWQAPTHSLLNIFIPTLLPLYSIYFPSFCSFACLLNNLCSKGFNHAGRETGLPAVVTYPLVMQRAAHYITHFINSVLLSLFHGLHPYSCLLLCLPGLWSSSVSLLIALPSQLRRIICSESFLKVYCDSKHHTTCLRENNITGLLKWIVLRMIWKNQLFPVLQWRYEWNACSLASFGYFYACSEWKYFPTCWASFHVNFLEIHLDLSGFLRTFAFYEMLNRVGQRD